METEQYPGVPRTHPVTSLVLLCEPELFHHVLASIKKIEGLDCVLDDGEMNHSVIVAETMVVQQPAQLIKLIQAVAGVLSITVVVHRNATETAFADNHALH